LYNSFFPFRVTVAVPNDGRNYRPKHAVKVTNK